MPPYDSVLSIGGQSLVDGVFHILGPALEELSNPLPLSLPGFSGAAMRILHVAPAVPGEFPAAFEVLVAMDVSAQALLNVTLAGGGALSVSLGPQALHLSNLTGTIQVPGQTGALTNLELGGNYPPPIGHVDLGPGTGTLALPATTATLTNGDLTGTLDLPGQLMLPSIPLPSVVPVAVHLTPNGPLFAKALLKPIAVGPAPATLSSLAVVTAEAVVSAITLDPALATGLAATLQSAVDGIVTQLGIPGAIVQSPVSVATVEALLAPVAGAIQSAVRDALSRLIGETGRLLYPIGDTTTPCDVRVLPTIGDAHLALAANGTYALLLGFGRAGSIDIPALPSALPTGSIDTTLLIGNRYLLELLGCMLERLPAFQLPVEGTLSTADINGNPHLRCNTFTDATLVLGPVALNGGASLCIDSQASTAEKSVTLVGKFGLGTTLANIDASFVLGLQFDLDSVASLSNLRLAEPATVDVNVGLATWLWVTLLAIDVGGGILGAILGGGATASIIVSLVILLLWVACRTAGGILTELLRTVVGEGSMVRSPVAVPPGLFEAFGRLVPVKVSLDDLTASSVLQTPTSPWSLAPRLGLGHPPSRKPTSTK